MIRKVTGTVLIVLSIITFIEFIKTTYPIDAGLVPMMLFVFGLELLGLIRPRSRSTGESI